jgi:excisionase family DNA binding protein
VAPPQTTKGHPAYRRYAGDQRPFATNHVGHRHSIPRRRPWAGRATSQGRRYTDTDFSVVFLCLSQTIEVVETMLKTSTVAHMLGVSRQHVVDMCDRGELRCVRVGTHRRIPHSEVDRLIGSDLRREEEQSLWLHYALLAPLLTEPEIVIAKARENLLRWSKKHRRDGMAIRYLAKWERVLDDGLDEIIHALTSPSQEARELRQNSPFAGVLADATRQRVLKTFKRHWAQRHGQDRAG